MNADSVPPHLRKLIGERIDSVAQLEILLLIHRNPDRAWSARQIAAELRVNEQWTKEQLELLRGRGFLTPSEGEYRYAPGAELRAAIAELAGVYALYPITVISLIYTKPNTTLENFADAFRLRKDPPGDAPDG